MTPPFSSLPGDPVPTRREEVVETLHGVQVVDPYRWLEDGDSAEVRAWSAAQTERAERLLAARPGVGALRSRIEALVAAGTVEPPVVVEGAAGRPRYFYRRQAPGQDQPV